MLRHVHFKLCVWFILIFINEMVLNSVICTEFKTREHYFVKSSRKRLWQCFYKLKPTSWLLHRHNLFNWGFYFHIKKTTYCQFSALIFYLNNVCKKKNVLTKLNKSEFPATFSSVFGAVYWVSGIFQSIFILKCFLIAWQM